MFENQISSKLSVIKTVRVGSSKKKYLNSKVIRRLISLLEIITLWNLDLHSKDYTSLFYRSLRLQIWNNTLALFYI